MDAACRGACGADKVSGLAATARASLVSLFGGAGHRPSTDQWAAVDDLLQHMERAAHGELQRAVYVSAIPAGTAKSTSIAAFAKALMSDPEHAETGMLITCCRVEECAAMAEALRDHRSKLCIIVGRANTSVLAMGDHTEANAAQVVVSTQAALRQTLKATERFADAGRYHYRGQRRAVLCWDESISFHRPVVLDGDTVGSLSKAMRRQSGEAANALLEWAAVLARAPTGRCAVPDFAGMGVDWFRLEDDVSDRDELVAQAAALTVISGGAGWVLRDNLQSALVTHVPELPPCLLPVIVTDASAAKGVHRASYDQMATTRPVVHLKAAEKTYTNMTVRIVPTAASRSTYRDKASPRGRDLIEMAVRYIRSVAPEEVLVVGYKNYMRIKGVAETTIATAIQARLTEDERSRVRHLSWGRHTATNAYKHVRHVVLMGLNFLPMAASYAASGAALEKPMRSDDPSDHPTEEQVEDIRRGMLRDSTLQAILRGNARLGVDGDCGEMEVVIPQTKQTGLSADDYAGMFPGAVMKVDHTLMPQKPLRGRMKDLADLVAGRLAAGEREITNPSLYESLGIARQDFAKLVKRPEWQQWVAAVGLLPCTLAGRMMGLRKLA
jgi:hypothetical protein